MKSILLTLVFCFSCSFTQAQYLNELKLNRKTSFSDTVKPKQILAEKSPVLAGALSFIVPGFALGQLYNGETSKFGVHLGITGGCILVGALGFANFHLPVGGNTSNTGNTTIGPVLIIISAAVFAGNWIWSVVDAVISANNVNKKVRLQKNRTIKTDNIYFGIGIGRNNKPDFNISVCF